VLGSLVIIISSSSNTFVRVGGQVTEVDRLENISSL